MIEFQYFDGCPNAKATLENLNDLIEEGLIDSGLLTVTELSDLASAERVHFQGSPTILVDGVDIYTGERPMTMNYTCRVFDFDGLKTGVIGKEFIRKRIRDLGLPE